MLLPSGISQCSPLCRVTTCSAFKIQHKVITFGRGFPDSGTVHLSCHQNFSSLFNSTWSRPWRNYTWCPVMLLIIISSLIYVSQPKTMPMFSWVLSSFGGDSLVSFYLSNIHYPMINNDIAKPVFSRSSGHPFIFLTSGLHVLIRC